MKQKELDPLERQTLEQMYRFHPKKQVGIRAHCLLLLAQGYSFAEVSKILRQSLKTIYNWMNRWLAEGLSGLYDLAGRGRKRKLSEEEGKQVWQIVEQAPRRIGQHLAEIQTQTGKQISKSTLKRTLKSMGLRWKRIRKWLGNLRDEQDFRMAMEELSSLKELEDKGVLELYFCDEVGFNQTPCVPYAWQAKGKAITIAPAKSRSYNVLGIINRGNDLQAYGFEQSINTQVIISCIDDFCHQRKQQSACLPAYLIIDNAPIHNSKAFREKEKQWEEKGVMVKRIPAYCPELNLIEILWRKIKYDWLPFDAYQSFDNLVQEVDKVITGVGKHFVINFD